MFQRYYFGIDLGTTNSVIAVYDSATGSNKAINVDHSTLLKSMITIPDSSPDSVLVGVNQGESSTIKDVKSSIGNDSLKYTVKGKEFTPVDVSSLVLYKLKQVAQKEYEGVAEVKDVTVTVPAKFNHKQRTNTVRAAQLAGLNVISLINEPTSATLAYIDSVKKQETVMVFDLGGGTFDVSIASIVPRIKALKLPKLGIDKPKIDKQVVSIICSDGDVNLGGNDLDNLMASYAVARANSTYSSEEYREIQAKAQNLKETGADYITWDDNNDKGRQVMITSDDFVRASNEIYLRAISIVKKMLSSYSSLSIDRIVLVGGSTKNDILRANIAEDFPGIKVYHNINPDECVALGAAKNTFIMSGNADTNFFDISSDSVGVQVINDTSLSFESMIDKGTTLPAKARKQFYRRNEDQSNLFVPVYQGEYANCKYNTYLGEVNVKNIPLNTPLTTPIVCEFNMNKDGILVCSVELAGRKETVTINSKANHDVEKSSMDTDLISAFDEILKSDEF